ncbi:YciI family protein [Roseateles cellulosilyticus]|uniref:YciI family protein n=1 Tax=Pelomonas cellulosilytica TaxID=2906762 RepID=A0ABS8XVK6_9BURK|nr:YciI family protein [Pelomonas sp. P8]MCE4556706.1 YciI family protein [Pelomonas sp. P8]
MASFITIGYGNNAGYEATPVALRDAAHAHDARLKARGVLMGIAGQPVQVRNPQGTGAQRSDGAYLSSQLPIAGFAVIEADSLEQAIELVAGTPCAIANGVVEVWPLQVTP